MYRMCYDLVAATNQSEGVVCYIISNNIVSAHTVNQFAVRNRAAAHVLCTTMSIYCINGLIC